MTHEQSAQPSKAEQIRREVDASLDRLATALDQGRSEQMTAFLAALAKFHNYSFGNILLILSQKPDASRVAGFHTWKKLDRSVKKGEKGIAIFAPMLIRQQEDNESDENASGEEAKKRLRFRVVYVFDLSQTEGEPLPQPTRVSGDPGEAMPKLESLVRACGIELGESSSLGGAEGVSMGGRIELRAGLSPAERFATLVHELAHELLHRVPADSRPPKTVRETEAEAIAFAVCEAIGLPDTMASADYIGLYRGDRQTLSASLDRIQRVASRIIEAITDERAVELRAGVSSAVALAAADRRQR